MKSPVLNPLVIAYCIGEFITVWLLQSLRIEIQLNKKIENIDFIFPGKMRMFPIECIFSLFLFFKEASTK